MSKISKTILGDLIEFQRGYDLPKSEFQAGEIPVISSNGILGYHNIAKVKAPGITIGRSGTVGLPHYINEDFFPHNTSLFIKDFKGNNPKYIYYLIKTLRLNEYGSGSGVPTMNRNHLHPIRVSAFLDIADQQKIAKVLSDLDAKIELNNKINSELEAMAKTLYDYWFVQFDFPAKLPSTSLRLTSSDIDAVSLSEVEVPYKSSGGKMVYNQELKREIPEGWEVGTLNDLGEIVGGSTPSKSIDDNFCSNGIPWITPKDLSLNSGKKFISRGELDASERGFKSASLKILPKGSILLSSRAPIGYMVISRNDVTTNQGFKSFIPNKGYLTSFVYYSIKHNMRVIEANASGSTFKEISGGVLKVIPICLATKNIVDLFTKKTQAIFIQQNVIEKQNQQLTSLRDWLLPMLMNGQITVKEAEEALGMVAENSADYQKR
ncbi:type I restriction enzyme S subunit [Flavobacterium sp. PL11]|uniref:restriction endonuclease subunit S n=1 Tax=Flavobacterium sp. PL11 TaxID=3071717 RepID=UPI002E04BB18|nr:type I restriction enzyme S subunit [Flavobacterium sp. PL11]